MPTEPTSYSLVIDLPTAEQVEEVKAFLRQRCEKHSWSCNKMITTQHHVVIEDKDVAAEFVLTFPNVFITAR